MRSGNGCFELSTPLAGADTAPSARVSFANWDFLRTPSLCVAHGAQPLLAG